jgi:enoyl-CoA hydratase/carnithine racemase
MNSLQFYQSQARMGRLMLKMRQVPQIIVCIVHGAAAGIGLSFALASDLRVISPDARFSAAYINIGLGGADMACSYFLPRAIGTGRAYEFMLTGNYMSAAEAVNLGFVSRLVERDRLMDTALELARTMNGKNPAGLRLTKEAINVNLDIGEILHMEAWNDDGTSTAHYRGANWSVTLRTGTASSPGLHRIVEVIGSRLVVEKL